MNMQTVLRTILSLIVMPLTVATTLAQEEWADDVPLATYLDALSRISPAARTGADTYLAAYEQRCGHPLKAITLRRAIADGNGNPVLMAMIRAASQRDDAALQRLSVTVSCAGGQ
jgi:hypothetical protein